MKKLIYAFSLIALISLVSCEKIDHSVNQKITYYPTLELEGDEFMSIDLNSTYEEPGYKAVLNGVDVTDQVIVDSDLDETTSGLYTITYSVANEDGFSNTATRTVAVFDPADPIEGLWHNTSDSYRDYDDVATQSKVAFGAEFTVVIIGQGDGVYEVDDLFAGWYAQRAGYGSAYAMGGTIKVDGSAVTCLDAYIPGWGDSIDSFTGVYTGSEISYDVSYAGSMTFCVTLEKD